MKIVAVFLLITVVFCGFVFQEAGGITGQVEEWSNELPFGGVRRATYRFGAWVDVKTIDGNGVLREHRWVDLYDNVYEVKYDENGEEWDVSFNGH